MLRGRSLRYRRASWRKETPEIDVTYVTIVFKLRRHQSLVFRRSGGRGENDRDGFSRFRRCYMTRVTAAGAPGRFLCSNNVALTGVYVRALLSPVISTFNDRNRENRRLEVAALRASAPRKTYGPPPFFTSPFSPFFSFCFTANRAFARQAGSSFRRCRDTAVPVQFRVIARK